MTISTHSKIIVTTIVTAALAVVAPAGASVLDPMTNGYNPSGGDVKTAATTVQRSDSSTQAEVQTINATVQHSPDSTQFTALRRDGSKAEPFVTSVAGTPVAHSGDGFDVSDAAIGGLLVAAAMLLGSSAIRKATGSQPGGTVSQGA